MNSIQVGGCRRWLGHNVSVGSSTRRFYPFVSLALQPFYHNADETPAAAAAENKRRQELPK
jgi:hypothetical protein